jgi:hypothetical protein
MDLRNQGNLAAHILQIPPMVCTCYWYQNKESQEQIIIPKPFTWAPILSFLSL